MNIPMPGNNAIVTSPECREAAFSLNRILQNRAKARSMPDLASMYLYTAVELSQGLREHAEEYCPLCVAENKRVAEATPQNLGPLGNMVARPYAEVRQ